MTSIQVIGAVSDEKDEKDKKEPTSGDDSMDAGNTAAWALPAHMVVRIRDAVVAAHKTEFVDNVPNKMGFDLIISAVINFTFIVVTFTYICAVLTSCFELIMEKAEHRAYWEAQHILCPFRCGGRSIDVNGKEEMVVNDGMGTWAGCIVGGCALGGYQVYIMLSAGFTDFRDEIVIVKTEQKDKECTIEGVFYEDVGRSHFGSVEMQTCAILKTQAKFSAKVKFKGDETQAITVKVEFDSAGQLTFKIPYFEDSSHEQKNSLKTKLDAKLSQGILDSKPADTAVTKTTEIPKRYMDDALGIACDIASPLSVKQPIQSMRVPRGLDFWIEYLIMVSLSIIGVYIFGLIFKVLGLAWSMVSGECDSAKAKEEGMCELPTIFSPVPVKYTRGQHYFDLLVFVLGTLGFFVFWWFQWPSKYEFYEEGIVAQQFTVTWLRKLYPRKAKILLYKDAISAAPGEDKGIKCYQFTTNVMYETEILPNAVPKISAKFNLLEPLKFNVKLSDTMETVEAQVKSSAPHLGPPSA